MNSTMIYKSLFAVLPDLKQFHSPSSTIYQFLKIIARLEAEERFSAGHIGLQDFGVFGEIEFPFFSMGAINSLDLFGLDELILFSFYWANKNQYNKVADIGANIGLHSLVLSRCGYDVWSFEPDPIHFRQLQDNISRNGCAGVNLINAAVSAKDGSMEFVRVVGNTTGSHLAGSKRNAYGVLEKFPVKVVSIDAIFQWADLIKLDVEGHEKQILLATTTDHWTKVDAMVEVGSSENASEIFEHLRKTRINMFAQKRNWGIVDEVGDMPTSYKDGSLFISSKNSVPW